MAKHAGGGPVDPVSGAATGLDQRRPAPATGPKHAVSTRPGWHRRVGLAVLALLAATVVIIVSRLDPATPDRAVPETSSTAADTSHALTTAPAIGVSASSERSASAITADSVSATLSGSFPQTGPGLSQPGIALIASPASDGSFDVVERVRLVRPVSVLTLRPASIDQAGQQFASASAAATQVQVSIGDQPVVVPGGTVESTLEVALPVAEADRFELRYRLTDITVLSTPSTTGRALAAIGPLTGGVDPELPVLFIVTGDTVLGLNCPLLPLPEQSCGSRAHTTSGVEHELPWRLALASVQFNLPAA